MRAILETIGQSINSSILKCCGRTLISLTERSAPESFASCVNTITASVVGRMPVNRGRRVPDRNFKRSHETQGQRASSAETLAPQKKLAGAIAVFAIVHCRPLLAIAAVASVVPAYRKCPPIQRLLHADRFSRRARNRSCAHKIGVSRLVQCPVSAIFGTVAREKA